MGRLEPVNTNQKSPSDSGANHPTGNSCNPLLGHAISHAATLIGLFAIVLWGFMAGLVRLVSESFGATLGSALIYTVGGVMLFIVRRPKPIREAPCKYLIAGGLMFIRWSIRSRHRHSDERSLPPRGKFTFQRSRALTRHPPSLKSV